jgi:hypothetical protein
MIESSLPQLKRAASDTTPAWTQAAVAQRCQPNEVDQRRILRLLEKRARYRYVTPLVEPTLDGYRVVSPCCSRNIETSGGVIDIALLAYDEDYQLWRLFAKDHERDEWLLYDSARQLDALMVSLIADPYRVFWQ